MGININELFGSVNIQSIKGDRDVEVNEIHFDSRKVKSGDLFVACRGTMSDGHDFIETAVEKGARVIVCEELPKSSTSETSYIVVEDSSAALSQLAHTYYNKPTENIQLVGVTGTNGKTTIATLLYHLFKKLGYKVGLLSTVCNYVDEKEIKATHTTPDSLQLNALLAEMVEVGCEYCFMEVSSHAIDQKRVGALNFKGGIFSNITHDHLDYHKTFDAYLKVKKAFFDQLGKKSFAITNADDKNGKLMLQNMKGHKFSYSTRSFADYRCQILEKHFSGMLLEMDGAEVWTNFIGDFNAHNLLAVYGTARLLNQNKEEVLKGISELKSVDGRFESIISIDGIMAIVDYAHTPDALKNVLETIGTLRSGNEQVITVVGAGGDRDKTKRPLMAKISAELSDKVILTSDNPRSEDPDQIIREMKEGVAANNTRKVLAISDRNEAIRTACMLAKKDDIILVAGKGHEDYQEIKGVKHHFDDKEIIREIFKL
ncbi:UDP-N-acetylmuramoyl-L-alanyl-D-glutamate--2,6-diaminopimelate ligase [Labilibaculum antarcticum]|uniref:UDP-N-acetylmuramoyl-L-alanyl-D-glutamate--2,6-diaminopimelate ligase n=1 Tax=Labilibaculum antarcticum TaxID=1717717 RepID=A0A1Y1CJP8_9BACT|nr:UDP-N-acetylmuramoyl-L-alanyl-D-glutamate--2,6-diaminopimelate ligase [Labilibaculum antarcticum]BAX80616.1 UDP-N-acetylmuramoyl-L-alanyl-D-glutamate--2,6-diaminopimelate ligase [Labilibaculum antarcticum]